MASRKRNNHSFSGTEMRLSTKKEKESDMLPSCPPLPRKYKSYLRNRLTICGEPKPVSVLYNAKLSSSYDNKSKVPYIKQMFVIIDKIGEGSFGTVYKVRSKEDGKLYAIKVLKRTSANLEVRYAEAFQLERLGNHPNIIKYFGAWDEKDHVFMQLELYDTSLDKYARSNHQICEDQLWDILCDMLLALKHLHDKNFIHLDIKPDNIMISNDGVYKLGDFGLLLDLLKCQKNKASHLRLSDGDAKYLAREVLEDHYSKAADVFSLGITLLELATDLVLPSNGPLWHKIRNGFLPDEHTGAISTALLRIIKSMMNDCHLNRPSVNNLLKVEPIKTRLVKRQTTPRVNYYQKWCEANALPVEEEPPVVKVYVQLNRNPDNSDEENAQVIYDNSSPQTPCVTPPRRVSQVVLYTL